MTVITKNQMKAKVDELAGYGDLSVSVEGLIAQPNFLALAQTGGGFYRAQFGQAEAQAKDPLEALSIAFLKDKGFEVVE